MTTKLSRTTELFAPRGEANPNSADRHAGPRLSYIEAETLIVYSRPPSPGVRADSELSMLANRWAQISWSSSPGPVVPGTRGRPGRSSPDHADATAFALRERERLAAGVARRAPRRNRRVEQVWLGDPWRARGKLDPGIFEQSSPLGETVGAMLGEQGSVREFAKRDLRVHFDHALVVVRVLVDLANAVS